MKKELLCEYCNNEITVDDKKCPNCGANCSKVVKEYKKTIEQEEQEALEKVAKKARPKLILSNLLGIGVTLFIIGVIVLAGVSIFKAVKSSGSTRTVKSAPTKVTVGYQEKAATNKVEATLLSYELYEFETVYDMYKTKTGYQKIAFEFEVENKTDSTLALGDIELKADGYNVEWTDVNVNENFVTVVQGKNSYPKLDVFIMKPNDKQKGYVGFEVPKDKKELEFKVGNDITIRMENPAYNQ